MTLRTNKLCGRTLSFVFFSVTSPVVTISGFPRFPMRFIQFLSWFVCGEDELTFKVAEKNKDWDRKSICEKVVLLKPSDLETTMAFARKSMMDFISGYAPGVIYVKREVCDNEFISLIANNKANIFKTRRLQLVILHEIPDSSRSSNHQFWMTTQQPLLLGNRQSTDQAYRATHHISTPSLPNLRVFAQPSDHSIDLQRQLASRRDDQATHTPVRCLLFRRMLQQPINYRNTESQGLPASCGSRTENVFPAGIRFDRLLLNNRGFCAFEICEVLKQSRMEVELSPFRLSIEKSC